MTGAWMLLSFVIGVWVGFGWSVHELRKERSMREDVFNRANHLISVFEKAFGKKP